MTTRRNFTLGIAGATCLAQPLLSHAQADANKPLETAKILGGFPPGGTTDTLSRRLADKLRGTYAGVVLVDNKPGAGGQIAVTALRDSPPDGSVMLLTPSSILSIYPFTYPKLPYKLEDVSPVSVACFFSLAFGVGPAVPESVKNIKDFLAWGKDNPTKSNYGSPAAGSMPHMIAALMAKSTNSTLGHVAYRGSAPGIQDLLAGQISAFSSPVGDYLPHLKGGKLRLLATSGPTRTPFTPDVPTLKEQGIDIALREWYGFFLPGKATPQVQKRAASLLQPALTQADVVSSLALVGMEVKSSTPEELAALLKADADEWRGLIKTIGFTAET
jgi:tripartite-type tricarboxylate transporter receptor subunit TctC